jgi:hypothetical protein
VKQHNKEILLTKFTKYVKQNEQKTKPKLDDYARGSTAIALGVFL